MDAVSDYSDETGNEVRSAAPAWFRQALANRATSVFTSVDGKRIHYLGWSLERMHLPCLVFVHGYRGHAHWWDFIAPFFADRFRIAALDLSGMGDSDHRDTYDLQSFAEDLAGVIADLQAGPVSVVGHSFGGTVAFAAGGRFPRLIGHTIAIDTYIRFVDTDPPRYMRQRGAAVPRPTYAAARARYRLLPSQPDPPAFLLNHVARHSLKHVVGGWVWKADPNLPGSESQHDGQVLLSQVVDRVDYVVGDKSSLVDAARAQRIVAGTKRGRGPFIIPDAHHHVPLDQPLALVDTLQTLLA